MKYISSPYWDSIKIPNVYTDIISQIMQVKNVKDLSPSINERITDYIFIKIDEEMKKVKNQDKTK